MLGCYMYDGENHDLATHGDKGKIPRNAINNFCQIERPHWKSSTVL